MICPHCHRNLKQKERGGRTCGHCKRTFALDPKENALLLHDLRLRKLVGKLSENGTYHYTAAQLHHSAARKALVASRPSLTKRIAVALLVAAVATFVFLEDSRVGAFVIGAAVLAAGVGLAVLTWRRARRRARALPMPPRDFGTMVLGRHRSVYGSNPPGLIDRVGPHGYDLDQCAAAVVSDQLTLECLRANGLPDALSLALVPVEDWHGRAAEELERRDWLPVLLLHDASPPALQLAGRITGQLGGRRVVDVGLRPRAVMRKPPLVLRTPPEPATLAEIRARGVLAAEEIDWLAVGNWVPLAAVRPAVLVRAVTRAAERMTAGADPERRRAKQISFLSWPDG